jgi:WhiB family redox-sensing transcriptional regulator
MAADWTLHAACRGIDTAVFFGDSARAAKRAREYCARCPVIPQCRDLAFTFDDAKAHGVFAGLTGKERDKIRKRRRRAEP